MCWVKFLSNCNFYHNWHFINWRLQNNVQPVFHNILDIASPLFLGIWIYCKKLSLMKRILLTYIIHAFDSSICFCFYQDQYLMISSDFSGVGISCLRNRVWILCLRHGSRTWICLTRTFNNNYFNHQQVLMYLLPIGPYQILM